MTRLSSVVSYSLTLKWRRQGNAGLFLLETFDNFMRDESVTFLSSKSSALIFNDLIFSWAAQFPQLSTQENAMT